MDLRKMIDQSLPEKVEEADGTYSLPRYEKFLQEAFKNILRKMGEESLQTNLNTKLPEYSSKQVFAVDELNKAIEDARVREIGAKEEWVKYGKDKRYLLNELMGIGEEIADPSLKQNKKVAASEPEFEELALRRVAQAKEHFKNAPKDVKLAKYKFTTNSGTWMDNLEAFADPRENLVAISDKALYNKNATSIPFHEIAHLATPAETTVQNLNPKLEKYDSIAQILTQIDKGHFKFEDQPTNYKYGDRPGLGYEVYKYLTNLLNKKEK